MLGVLDELKNELYQMFNDENTGHDISHLIRVLDYALDIQKFEGGDIYVVAISALVHDLHRLMSNKCGYYVYSNYGKNVKNEFCLECSPQPRNNEDIDKFERLISKLLRNSNINYYIQETTKKPLGTIYLCLY
jgi:hypothetical protein